MTNLKSAHSKKGTCEISLRLESQYFRPKMPEFEHLGPKFEKRKVPEEIPDFLNFQILGRFRSFCDFWWSFLLVSDCFG